MSEYESVGGGLKFKGSGGVKKRKKKSKKAKKVSGEEAEPQERRSAKGKRAAAAEDDGPPMTAAEKAFAKVQAQREAERIRKAASKSHREKVQELNQYLDTLSEHYDIPKVSWTK